MEVEIGGVTFNKKSFVSKKLVKVSDKQKNLAKSKTLLPTHNCASNKILKGTKEFIFSLPSLVKEAAYH
jgi:hypothetical protein